MKHCSGFTLLAVVFLAATTFAQIDPDPDGIGIYADMEGNVNSVNLEVGQPLEVYLLLTRPSAAEPELLGWQCGIEVPDNVSIWGWSIPGAFLNFGSPPNFCVGRGADPTPLLGTTIYLMSFIIVPLDSNEAVFTITDGGWITPYEGYPIYQTGLGNDYAYAMDPYPSGPGEMTFSVNGTVPNEMSTWGEVKALYDR